MAEGRGNGERLSKTSGRLAQGFDIYFYGGENMFAGARFDEYCANRNSENTLFAAFAFAVVFGVDFAITQLSQSVLGDIRLTVSGFIIAAVVAVAYLICYFSVHNLFYKKCAVVLCWIGLLTAAVPLGANQFLVSNSLIYYLLMLFALAFVPVFSGIVFIPMCLLFSAVYLVAACCLGMHGEVIAVIIVYALGVSLMAAFKYLLERRKFDQNCALERDNANLCEKLDTDELTGLIVYTHFFEQATTAFEQKSGKACLLTIDADGFKEYNAKRSRADGDDCLRLIACYLDDMAHNGDLVTRVRGDCFALLCFGARAVSPITIGNEFQEKLRAMKLNYGNKTLTVSIGAAVADCGASENLVDFFARAEEQLAHAQSMGGCCLSYESVIYRIVDNSFSQSVGVDSEDEYVPENSDECSERVILVVDDNAINREMLSNIVSQNYRVVTAENGSAALEVLEFYPKKISAVLLDLLMPVMDGFELLRRINGNEKYKNIPTIVLTGNGDKENEKRALAGGAWDFVTKPYDPDIINFRIRNAIDRSKLSAIKRLKYLAEYDELTGIFNKTKFFADANALRERQPSEYMMIRFDVNHFGYIKTLFGPKRGEGLLKHIAVNIKQLAQNEGCAYGRIEADVFAVFKRYVSEQDMLSVIGRIGTAVSRYANIKYNITLNYGICICGSDISIETAFDRAKLAFKRCKGDYVKNYAVYNQAMGDEQSYVQMLSNQMENALATEQFSVYYQLKYDLTTDAPSGAEALVRWIHPELGLIAPSKFIPVFEKNGFVSKLDYYVWKKVCAQLSGRLAEGKRVMPVSVNVSRVHLFNPDFVADITRLIEEYQVPKQYFLLELTESAYIDDTGVVLNTVTKLHEEGFTILMDDFGSGYSSLNILRELRFDALKIDMRFFDYRDGDTRAESIIGAVISMAKKLGVPTVAEGVETNSQVDFLKGIGCEYAQGFFYAKPIPANQYFALLDAESGSENLL